MIRLPISQSNILILFFYFFVKYTIIQNITSSEMCSLHLTHSSAHTWSSGQPALLRCPGSSRGFSALLKGLTSVVDNSCRSRDSNPQPQVTCPTLYLLGHDCPHDFAGCYDHAILAIMGCSMSDFTYNYTKLSPNKFMYSLLWQCFK